MRCQSLHAAALGEMWAGGGKGSKNLVMVTLGTGVGGGIIVDGKIVAGAHGAGGEVVMHVLSRKKKRSATAETTDASSR